MKKEEAERLYELVEKWTRCEIMGRHGVSNTHTLEFADYTNKHLKYEDKIREHIWGTSDLVELGRQWGLLQEHKRTKKKGKLF